jgi:hypothetical protein
MDELPNRIVSKINISTIPKCRIYMARNRISNIDDVSCLLILDTLILKSNAIEYFNKDMFLRMKRIRVIDLSYNRIKSYL